MKAFKRISEPFLIIIFLVPSLIWILRDQRVWNWDEAFYGLGAYEIKYGFRISFANGINTISNVLKTKAPLISWLGSLFIAFQNSLLVPEQILMLAQTFTLFLLILVTGLATSKNVRRLDWTAMLLLLSTPFTVTLSHYYFVEPVQALTIAFVLYLFSRREKLKVWPLLGLSFVSGVLLLTGKVSSPVYIFVFEFFIGIELLKRRAEFRNQIKFNKESVFLILISALFTLLSTLWYLKNFHTMMAFASNAASGKLALLYGHSGSISEKWAYWTSSFERLFFFGRTENYLFAIVVLALILGWKKILRNRDTFIALAQILLTLLLFSTQINQEVRYLFPIFPIAAFFIARLVNEVSTLKWITVLLALSSWYGLEKAFFAEPISIRTAYAEPIEKDSKIRDSEIRLIHTACSVPHPAQSPVKIIVGVDVIYFNADSMRFMSLSRGIPESECDWRAFGHAATDIDIVLKGIDANGTDEVVFLDTKTTGELNDPFNQVSLLLFQRLTEKKWIKTDFEGIFQILKRPQ